jgi:predicted transcriptional regulator
MVNYTSGNTKAPNEIDKFAGQSIADIMEGKFAFVEPDTSVLDASKVLLAHKVSGAPVVGENKELVGFLSEKDCLKFIFEMKYYNGSPLTVGQHMSKGIISLDSNDTIFHALELFMAHPYHIYPVVDNNRVVGIIQRSAVLKVLSEVAQTTW